MKKTEPALLGADRKVCNDAAQYPEYTLGRILSQEKRLVSYDHRRRRVFS